METGKQSLSVASRPTPSKTGKSVTFSEPGGRAGIRRRDNPSLFSSSGGDPKIDPVSRSSAAAPPVSILKPSSPPIRWTLAEVSPSEYITTPPVVSNKEPDIHTNPEPQTGKADRAKLEARSSVGDTQERSLLFSTRNKDDKDSTLMARNRDNAMSQADGDDTKRMLKDVRISLPQQTGEKELTFSAAKRDYSKYQADRNERETTVMIEDSLRNNRGNTGNVTGSNSSNNSRECGSSCGKSETGKDKPQQSVSPLRHGVDLSFLRELKTKHKFSVAFDHQNQVAATAIKSLDSLNDQIVQYIFGQQTAATGEAVEDPHGNNPSPPPPVLHLINPDPHSQGQGQGQGRNQQPLSPREQSNLQASMVLIRRLLQDAQSKFRNMVEENKQLAVRIDGSIQSANQEVHALRAELADTNKRLSEISTSGDETVAVVEDKGGGVCGSGGSSASSGSTCGGGGGFSGSGGGGGSVRPGVKETDIDGCFPTNLSQGSELRDGGESGGGGRTVEVVMAEGEGEEKTDANKEEEVTLEGKSESEASPRADGETLGSDVSLGKGWWW